MADTVVTSWVQPGGAARQNRTGGVQMDTGPQAWPTGGVNVIQARLDVTPFNGTSTDFNDPAKFIDWTLGWSMDGGATWLSLGGAEQGSPTGAWGKSSTPYPHQELDFSTQASLPTHFRAQCTPRQTLSFGASFQSLIRTPSIR